MEIDGTGLYKGSENRNLEKEAVSRKELMVMTNAPRFFREGDRMMFTAKLVSLSEQKLQGQVTAEFFDAFTMQPIDTLLGNLVKTRDFSVEKGNSGVYRGKSNSPGVLMPLFAV